MIDKDIELVSNLKNVELKGKVNEQYIYAKIPEEYLNAIENVLADREMWKKIAEFLADEGEFNSNKYCDEDGLVCMVKHPERECTKCIIDWSRKEVENGN